MPDTFLTFLAKGSKKKKYELKLLKRFKELDSSPVFLTRRKLIPVASPKKIFFSTLPYFSLYFLYSGIIYYADAVANEINVNRNDFVRFYLPSAFIFIYHFQKPLNLIPRFYNWKYKKKIYGIGLSEDEDDDEDDEEEFENDKLPFVTTRQYICEAVPTGIMAAVYFLNNAFFDQIARDLKISDKMEQGVVSLLFLTFLYYLFDATQLANRLHNIGLKKSPKRQMPIGSFKHSTISNIPTFILMGLYVLVNYYNKEVAEWFHDSPEKLGIFWLPVLSMLLLFMPVAYFNPISRLYNCVIKQFNDDDEEDDHFFRYRRYGAT